MTGRAGCRASFIASDDALIELTGLVERSALIHEGLRSLIQREAARRLAMLGGSMPDAAAAPRRRSRLVPVAADAGTLANARREAKGPR